MAKVWISLVLLCVAITCATEMEYDDYYDSMVDDNYDKSYDYIKPDEKIDDDDPEKGDADIFSNSEKESYLGEDEKVDSEAFKEAAEFNSNEEKDKETIDLENYDEIPGLERFFPINDDLKDDQDADLPDGDIQSEEISFDVDKNIEPIPLPPVGETEKNIPTSTKSESSFSETGEKDIIDKDVDLKRNEDFEKDIKSKEDVLNDLAKAEPDFRDILDEDSVDKAYEDLNKDLQQLMETWKKLTVTEEKNADDSLSPDDILEYEEKYGRPYNEGIVLSQRDNFYEDDNPVAEVKIKNDTADDSKQSKEDTNLFADLERDIIDEQSKEKIVLKDDLNLEKKENDDNIDFAEDDTNNSAEELGNETEDEIDNDDSLSVLSEEEMADVDFQPINQDKISKNNDVTDNVDNVKSNIETNNKTKEQQKMYVNDAIKPVATEPILSSTTKQFRTMNVSELSAEQYDQLMAQFQVAHRDEIDVDSSNFARVPVKHIPITLDEPVYVTSPNYPENYPTNNIIDWIFEGEGVGIELNITDFAVNGVRGDYLLVKPGGVDESGTDGLVFSYHLNEPRRYRFLDVDRMFVRFVATSGFQMFRGFKFSVKMVAPLPLLEEEIPEPEPELPEPVETLTLILGGMPAVQFTRIEEEFRVLLADMALMYINENEIDPGLNSTLTVTQITSVSICNINWPNFENCTQVTFAVPLVYEDQDNDDADHRLSTEDLSSMWFGYYTRDPFAARLRRLGITEFDRPNDRSVLTIWVVISLGIIAIMVIMGIALWRYSCLDSYTRMPEPSFRDSVYNEKQGLDLYPTPHQTLPPLYDSDYKWSDGKYDHSTRVTMDGYSNRNFTRDELSDIETDEEVISTRGRYTTDV